MTEKNRNEVKNGSVLSLRHSPSKTANDILDTLKTGTTAERTAVLENLASLSCDVTFALELIKEQGLDIIIGKFQANFYNCSQWKLLSLKKKLFLLFVVKV